MWRVTVSLATICLLVQVKASPDISLEDLLDRLVTLEDWKRETEKVVSTLRETVTQQGIIIKNLERELAIQTNLTATLGPCAQNQDTLEHKVNTKTDEGNDEQVSKNRIRATHFDNQIPVQSTTLSKRQIAGGVAFTTYLDHDVDLGSKQTIKFNQIITNDGDGYSIHTGTFTCPEAGVYLFTFFIGERSEADVPQQLAAELIVNSQQVVSAIVDTVHGKQDLQGGNTAVVRLNPGDAVWVDVVTGRTHVEGRTGLRLTTFTGVYLYA